jgi:hypothetical protein
MFDSFILCIGKRKNNNNKKKESEWFYFSFVFSRCGIGR